MNKKVKEYGLEDMIPFGKYKDTKVRVIIMNDPVYIKWFIENTNFVLDNQAFNKFCKVMEKL